MLKRASLFALDRAIQAGAVEAAQTALKGYDPLVRVIVRKRLRRAMNDAARQTTVQEPAHLLRVAYLTVATGMPEADYDAEEAIAAEQAAHVAKLPKPPRRGPWFSGGILGAVLLVGAAALVLSIVLRPFDPRSTDAGHVLSDGLAGFVAAVNAGEDRDLAVLEDARDALGGPMARAALGDAAADAAGKLMDATEVLADQPSDADARDARHAFYAASVGFNRALLDQGLPYFIDEDIIVREGRVIPLLFGYYVQEDLAVTAGDTKVRAVHLWRLDNLNKYHGSLGFTRPHTPAALVLLDRVESDLVLYVLPGLPPGEPMDMIDEETEAEQPAWAKQLPQTAADVLRKHFADLSPEQAAGVARVGELLARRRALVKKWSGMLSGQRRQLRVPKRLIPEGEYSKDLELRIPRAELREWDALHEQLLERETYAAFIQIRDDRAASVERHEVQHRLDFARGLIPVPELLAQRLGLENRLDAASGTLAGRSRDELSAYLAAIAQAERSPLLDLVLLARHMFSKYSLGGPYSYAALVAFEGIGEELGVHTREILGTGSIGRAQLARLFLAVTSYPPKHIQAATARFYRKAYGIDPPQVTRVSAQSNPPWRH